MASQLAGIEPVEGSPEMCEEVDMGKRIRRRVSKPTEQEVVEYLEGLNQISRSPVSTQQERIVKGLAIVSYLQWFTARRVPIYKDARSQTWLLGWPPDF